MEVRTAILHDNERVLTAKQNAPILKARVI